MENEGSYQILPIAKLTYNSAKKLEEFANDKLSWNKNEIIGILVCRYPWSDFVLNVLIPKAIQYSSTIHVMFTSEKNMEHENSILQKSKYSKETLDQKIKFEQVDIEKLDQFTLTQESKFDKFFCIHDLWFFEDIKSFFQNLGQNILKDKAEIGYVIPFSKVFDIPRRMFADRESTIIWATYDTDLNDPTGKLLPGHRIATWASEEKENSILFPIKSMKSVGFESIKYSHHSFNEVFQGIDGFLGSLTEHTYIESFTRISQDEEVDRRRRMLLCMDAMVRALEDCFNLTVQRRGFYDPIEFPFNYLTCVARKI